MGDIEEVSSYSTSAYRRLKRQICLVQYFQILQFYNMNNKTLYVRATLGDPSAKVKIVSDSMAEVSYAIRESVSPI